MMIKVSVIIPCYNAIKHIERCCHALFSQSLNELELIFVDDHSSDGTAKFISDILLQYPDRVPYTKIVIHEYNMGVGAARATGNSIAQGEYIIHCDSDDFPEIDMYSRMYEKAISENAEVVICNYKSSGKIVSFVEDSHRSPTFDISPIEGAVWNKLIKREHLEKYEITFSKDLILGEDFLYVNKARLLANNVVHIADPLYNYTVDNDESITRRFTEKKCKSVVNVAIRMEEFLKEYDLLSDFEFKLNYLKYQAKSFYLIFPETRNLKKYKQIFPECEVGFSKYPVSSYRRVCSYLIERDLGFIADMFLKLKDLRNQVRFRLAI